MFDMTSMLRTSLGSCLLVSVLSLPQLLAAQSPGSAALPQDTGAPLSKREQELLNRIDKLEQRLAALEARSAPAASAQLSSPVMSSESAAPVAAVQTNSGSSSSATASSPPANSSPLEFSDGTTLNFGLDGYFGYNFNHPAGRVNLLRANDPLSDSFSLNQAVVMVERTPDPNAGRRFGYRLDLMFGQQTEILQGSAANEPRPQVYRNIYQAYGSYVLPIGTGLQLDFGKFSSALGVESSYAKDQLNYSRSFYYDFLPFYHEGVRATYNVNSKLSLQYWLVNGANQTEDFNGFKSQAALVTVKPNSNITWNLNYYEGQEQRDVLAAYNPGVPLLPTQPGLSTTPVTAEHDGRLHVIDSYASFNLGSKWSATVEGDYVINRVAANAAPARVYGGVGYLHRQLSKSLALNGRFEYMADRGGLFSGISQDLKDATGTLAYRPADGFETRFEYRKDFSNQSFFLTNNPLNRASSQNTLTLGMLWWFGGKQGVW